MRVVRNNTRRYETVQVVVVVGDASEYVHPYSAVVVVVMVVVIVVVVVVIVVVIVVRIEVVPMCVPERVSK